jgi:small redox-active disulfide protein 2
MDKRNLKLIKMEIKVLGSGCARCKSLEKVIRQAVEELGINASIEKVEDFQKIMQYNIMQTPGLVVNENVVLSGQVPKVQEIKDILTKIQSK